jgi:2-desacetyl-2-hydroxyethyl bacteriochlorophyllide A dehydrogenase
MRAALITAPGSVEIAEVADPTPGPRNVVISMASAGICGTDLHIFDGDLYSDFLPVIPGHEGAGTVVAIGAEVRGITVGDNVAVDPSLPCNTCHYCRRGQINLCENYAAIGVTVAGMTAEFASVPMECCFVLPEHVDPADAPLIEPLACAVRGFDVLRIRQADHALIYGAGTMGLMMMALAKNAGTASVSVVDTNPERLVAARALGCTAVATSADELNRPRGWEIVIDCTGVVAAIADGLTRTASGGTFLQFGVASPDARVAISPFEIYNREITIAGSMANLNSFGRAVDLFAAGVLRPDVFISDRLPLDQYASAIKKVQDGVGRKIQIQPNRV